LKVFDLDIFIESVTAHKVHRSALVSFKCLLVLEMKQHSSENIFWILALFHKITFYSHWKILKLIQ